MAKVQNILRPSAKDWSYLYEEEIEFKLFPSQGIILLDLTLLTDPSDVFSI